MAVKIYILTHRKNLLSVIFIYFGFSVIGFDNRAFNIPCLDFDTYNGALILQKFIMVFQMAIHAH